MSDIALDRPSLSPRHGNYLCAAFRAAATIATATADWGPWRGSPTTRAKVSPGIE